MSLCILFILFNGSAYITPACYESYGFAHDNYELVSPHRVAFVQQIPTDFDEVLYESPHHYLDYYRTTRTEYCGKYDQYERRQQWVPGHYSYGNYIPGYWTGGFSSWGQGWSFWTPKAAQRPKFCVEPVYHAYTSHNTYAHYYYIPYKVRHKFKRQLTHYKKANYSSYGQARHHKNRFRSSKQGKKYKKNHKSSKSNRKVKRNRRDTRKKSVTPSQRRFRNKSATRNLRKSRSKSVRRNLRSVRKNPTTRRHKKARRR